MDVEKIVDKMADMGLIRPNKKIGNYYSCYCPIHNGGNERKPSFGILMTEEYRNGQLYPQGFAHCFACQIALPLPDLITEILKSRNINEKGIDWLKENVEGFEGDFEFEYLIPQDMMTQMKSKFALNYIKQATQQTTSYVSEEELSKYRFTVDYVYKRKLTDAVIEKYDVGFDANYTPPGRKNPVPCVTFPVRDSSGRTLFICRRSIEGKAFYMPSGITKPLYGLYELDKNSRIVIIAESCFNVLTAAAYGYNAVGLLGTGTPFQINQLRSLGVKEFVLGVDPDEAGDRAAHKLKNALKDVAIVRRMNDIPQGKDLNDLSFEEFNEIYQSRM